MPACLLLSGALRGTVCNKTKQSWSGGPFYPGGGTQRPAWFERLNSGIRDQLGGSGDGPYKLEALPSSPIWAGVRGLPWAPWRQQVSPTPPPLCSWPVCAAPRACQTSKAAEMSCCRDPPKGWGRPALTPTPVTSQSVTPAKAPASPQPALKLFPGFLPPSFPRSIREAFLLSHHPPCGRNPPRFASL